MNFPNAPFIIPIFIPHRGCPHQCAFCNQVTITGNTSPFPSKEEMVRRINAYLSLKKDRTKPVQIAFYGGNFLGLQSKTIQSLLTETEKFIYSEKVESIRFSTRPDTIAEQQLDAIQKFSISTIELGAQSMDDHVLLKSNRGHTAEDTAKAAGLVRERGFKLGLQMMTGLPGDSEKRSLATAHQIADLLPDFIRIYPTVVLAGSPLAAWYRTGKYSPMSLYESVTLVKKIYQIFNRKSIPVIRIGLQASSELDNGENLIAGPYHPAFGHMVFSEIFLEQVENILKNEEGLREKNIAIHVHPRSISKMRGLKNRNINILKNNFQLKSIAVISNETFGEDQIEVEIPAEEG
jgi:histone acetyltransferase (RNA polymerase elongator complex component)